MSGAGGITTLVVHEGGTAVVGVFGELDQFTGPELCPVLAECLDQRPVRLLLDLSGVSFCDAAGLTALVAARGGALQAGAEFALTGVQPVLLRVLAITGLDALFVLRPQHGPAASSNPAS
ncbi:STAS domain-containing protein [Streptomyces collinus]|uniref:STAS domain-containing protein n=1 Tax=Streptomyces collinus TaxID=42684 RepID=UPI0036BCC9BC